VNPTSAGADPRPALYGESAAQPLVSVVVPVHNGAGTLGALLDALRAQTLRADRFEVLVVDDTSSDSSIEIVRSAEFAQVIETPAQLGSYGARNLGVARARAEILAFTDADCVPDPSWLANGLAGLDDSRSDLLAGHVEIPLGRSPSRVAVIDAAMHLNQESYVHGFGFGATANLFVRRNAFHRVGAFDGRLRSGGDKEFGNRAVAAGLRLDYWPDAVVAHGARSAGELMSKGYRFGYASIVKARRAGVRVRPLWTQVGSWLPEARPLQPDRLAARRYRMTPTDAFVVPLVHWVTYRLPMVLGSLAGTVAEWRSGRRPEAT